MSTTIETNKKSAFAKLLESGNYEYYVERGQIVSGKVVEFSKEGVYVDIGAKSEAFLPMKEVSDYATSDPSQVLTLDAEYEFYILRDEAANIQDPRIVVSYKRVSQARVWENLESCKRKDQICQARIQEVVKGGVVVEIDGLRGFIPASHLRVKGGSNNPELVGESIPCTILEIDRQQNKLILSQKLAISQLYAGEREKLMNSLVEGLKKCEEDAQNGIESEAIKVNGEVVRITDFGAFIKIEDTEMDGLLPLSEICWKKISHPTDALKIGDVMTVKVLNVVPEQSRISLSLKRLKEDPWLAVKDKVQVGNVIDVKIIKITNFGVFITTKIEDKNLEDYGFEALMAIDDIKGSENNPEILNKFEIDMTFKAAIRKIKHDDRRILLSTKCLDENNNLIAGSLEIEEVKPKAETTTEEAA